MKSWKKPTPEEVQRAIALLAHKEQYCYFFNCLENPEWIEPLWAWGFFRNPPPPERNEEEGTIRFPRWPEARYLARMAPHKPELVAEVIQQMPDTDNVTVQDDLVDALLMMPPEVAAKLVGNAERWAESAHVLFLLPDKLGKLIAHMAKGGKTGEAMAIARVLLEVLPDPKQEQLSQLEEPYQFPPEPQGRFEPWHYEQILQKHYPELVRAAGIPALDLLGDLLEKAIRLSRRRADDEGPEDFSYVWRPAIEDHPQNIRHSISDVLVGGLRDAAILAVRSGKATVEEIVKALERRPWKVFRRIALHVLDVFTDQAGPLVAERLTDRRLFDDVGLLHEYVALLRKGFPRLSPENQQTILGWIEEGPDVEGFKEWRKQETGFLPPEDEIARYREIWQLDWLARLGADSLPGDWRERYEKLVSTYGEPEHPDFVSYYTSWVGHTSPKTADELKAVSVEEIVVYMQTWRPSQSHFGEPSPEGLGRVLSSVVAEEPYRFASMATRFQDLDPTYVRALLSGLRDGLKPEKAFDWGPVLDLCEWVVKQPRKIPGRDVKDRSADPDWGWTRKTIASLLSAGFKNGPGSIPIELRDKTWAILVPLTEDPDPTPEDEQRDSGSSMDPATLSINTTRGEAMHAVVRYALWVRRHHEKQTDAEERLRQGFEEMPEVRDVLDAHLDTAHDPSLAIRAVYGQWFPWLVLLDPGWARENVSRIFPLDMQHKEYFEAAWNTYIAFCRPYDDVLELLRDWYGYAIERIGSSRVDVHWPADPGERLAEHLMALYWRGKIDLTDPLLETFWNKASDSLRAHAIKFIGHALRQTQKPVPDEILVRLQRLWEERFSRAKEEPANHEKEVSAFGWWFVSDNLDSDWAIAQLHEALQLIPKTNPDHMVLEKLARTVETHPQKSVECLRMMAEGDREGWGIYASRQDIRRILGVALSQVSARDEAKRVINYLGRRGFLEFRDLLER